MKIKRIVRPAAVLLGVAYFLMASGAGFGVKEVLGLLPH